VTRESPPACGICSNPQENVTGVWDHIPIQQETQLQILQDIVGGARLNVGVLFNGDNPGKQLDLTTLQQTRLSGATLDVREYPVAQDLATVESRVADAFARAKGPDGRDAMIVFGDPLLGLPKVAQRIRDAGAAQQLRTMFGASEAAEHGGLMAYGPSHRAVMQRAADFVDRILHGTPIRDLPVVQPGAAELEFVVNKAMEAKPGLGFLNKPGFQSKWNPRIV
jgi:putative tryptophan/tyrosine transport system substrate-binding protein